MFYCYQMNEETQASKKDVMNQLLDKNLEIAKKTYGNESIHMLKHQFVHFMCKMAISNTQDQNQAKFIIQMMVQIIQKFHGQTDGDISNQFYYQI